MKVSKLYYDLKVELSRFYNDENSAKVVVAAIFDKLYGISLEQILAYGDNEIENYDQDKLNSILTRIKNNEPIEYILNSAQFLDLELYTFSSVLIPRPETEQLALMISKDIDKNPVSVKSVLDIGTGSGCISIFLALKYSNINFYGCDISTKALATAEKNAQKYNVKNFNLVNSDILSWKDDKFFCENKFDIIVSNPPYVVESEKSEMKKNVLDYEPYEAIFVPDNDPLRFYVAILNYAQKHLNKGGDIYFEINEKFGVHNVQLLENYGFENVNVHADCFGKERFVTAKKLF